MNRWDFITSWTSTDQFSYRNRIIIAITLVIYWQSITLLFPALTQIRHFSVSFSNPVDHSNGLCIRWCLWTIPWHLIRHQSYHALPHLRCKINWIKIIPLLVTFISYAYWFIESSYFKGIIRCSKFFASIILSFSSNGYIFRMETISQCESSKEFSRNSVRRNVETDGKGEILISIPADSFQTHVHTLVMHIACKSRSITY